VTNELVSRFLGQNIRSNTIELKYEVTHRVSAYIGYMYTARTIADFNATFDTGEIYLPEAPAATWPITFCSTGDCAVVGGALPAGCTVNPTDRIQEGSANVLVPDVGNDTSRNLYDIHEQAALLGVSAPATDTLRVTATSFLDITTIPLRVPVHVNCKATGRCYVHSGSVGKHQRSRRWIPRRSRQCCHGE